MGRVNGLIFLAINVGSSNISNDKVPLVFGYEVSTTTREKEGLSFPLGTGMVVLTIIFISAIFSFCYHWFHLKKLISPYNPPSPSTNSSTNTNHINSSINANYISFSPNHNYMNPSSMVSMNKTMDNVRACHIMLLHSYCWLFMFTSLFWWHFCLIIKSIFY